MPTKYLKNRRLTEAEARAVEVILLSRAVVDEVTGCWRWPGASQQDGRGWVYIPGQKGGRNYAHRLAAEIWLGYDPTSDEQINHTCDTPGCYNPAHVYVGTQQDNVDDMWDRGRADGYFGSPTRERPVHG